MTTVIVTLLPLIVPLSIPAGYYSLAELSLSLAKQGVPVRVAANCAGDVYALRAVNGDWDGLRAALIADGRLTIGSDGRRWNVALDEANREGERTAFARYVESVRAGLHTIYEPAARRALELWPLPEEKRDEALEADRAALGPDPTAWKRSEAVRYGLVRRALSERLFGDYQNLSLPAFLTAPGSRFGAARTATMFDAAPIMVPGGDLRQHPALQGAVQSMGEAALMARARELWLGGKIVWDPLTLATGLRSPVWAPQMAKTLEGVDSGDVVEMLTPKTFSLNPPSVPSGSASAARENRRTATGKTVESLKREFDLPGRTLMASEAMLRWAEGSGTDLAAYVSPLGDLPLEARERRTLGSVVRDIDAGAIDGKRLEEAIHEWTGLSSGGYFSGAARGQKLTFRLPAGHRLSVVRAGGFVVVRTEMRFLDGVVSASLPTVWANRRLKNEPSTLSEIVREVAGLKPNAWKGGIVPFGALERCNPVSFYPFAAMLSDAPKLMAEIAALGDSERLSRPLASLPGALPLRNAIAVAAPFNDAVVYQSIDPMFVGRFIRDPSVPLELDVARKGGRLTFEVVAPKRSEGGMRKTIWASWARLL